MTTFETLSLGNVRKDRVLLPDNNMSCTSTGNLVIFRHYRKVPYWSCLSCVFGLDNNTPHAYLLSCIFGRHS